MIRTKSFGSLCCCALVAISSCLFSSSAFAAVSFFNPATVNNPGQIPTAADLSGWTFEPNSDGNLIELVSVGDVATFPGLPAGYANKVVLSFTNNVSGGAACAVIGNVGTYSGYTGDGGVLDCSNQFILMKVTVGATTGYWSVRHGTPGLNGFSAGLPPVACSSNDSFDPATGCRSTASAAANIPVFGPIGLLASLAGLLWFGRRRKDSHS